MDHILPHQPINMLEHVNIFSLLQQSRLEYWRENVNLSMLRGRWAERDMNTDKSLNISSRPPRSSPHERKTIKTSYLPFLPQSRPTVSNPWCEPAYVQTDSDWECLVQWSYLGYQTRYLASSSKFHHLALLMALVSYSSNFHHWPLLVLLVALVLHEGDTAD